VAAVFEAPVFCASSRTSVGRHLIREKRAKMAKLVVEAVEHGEDEVFVEDFLFDVAESIGKKLELGAIVMDGLVSLRRVVELSVKGEGAAFLIVVEEVGDGVRNLPRCRSWRHDDAEEFIRNRAVDP
jgi:hypothetical protein